MSLSNHLNTLKLRHSHVDEDIAIEQRRPSPDMTKLSSLKRERLHLKEEISKLLRVA